MTYAAPATPPDESGRLAELAALDVLDTEPEEPFDDLTRLAGFICGTPIALVSLVDAERQWFKARVGLEVAETPRDVSFCAHAILDPDRLFVVADASQDERFRENPLVTGDPNIKFYAGMPLRTAQGSAVGTLCVIDRVPRDLSAPQREALVTLSRAVVAQLNLRRRLHYLSFYDPVTGLPNRAGFEDQFGTLAPQVRGGCLLAVGMDQLDKIAAAYGAGAIDSVLKQVAQRLHAHAPAGAIVALVRRRLFALFVAGEEPADFARFATQRLAAALLLPYAVGDEHVGCAIHLGASSFPDDGRTPAALLTAAERAVDSASNRHETFRFYNEHTDQATGAQLRLESELRKALARAELVNYYQPKVNLAGGGIVGAEALVRWRHPDRGLVSPAEFIPVLESSGLILEAGRQVLARAVADHCAWRDAGLDAPRIAVNATALQLRDRDFLADIRRELAAGRCEPRGLSIEL